MKIIINNNYTEFQCLRSGNVFSTEDDSTLYMKMAPIYADPNDDLKYNAVALDDGGMYSFKSDNEVILRDDICVTNINNIKSL